MTHSLILRIGFLGAATGLLIVLLWKKCICERIWRGAVR